MSQKVFVFDQQYCIGCQCCQVACNARHGLPAGTYPRQAKSFQVECGGPYLTASCNHCNNPACVANCPTGALQKRSDGIVVHNPDVCIGCFACKLACPYDAPQVNPRTNTMVKCDMCAARQDMGDTPACVLACPMKVIMVMDEKEAAEMGAVKEGAGFGIAETDPNYRFIPIER